MITRSRTRHTDEPTDLEEDGARKKQVVASYEVGTKRQHQERQMANDQQLAIYDGGQAMAASEEVPKSYVEATTGAGRGEWKNQLQVSWSLSRPAHQRPIGFLLVFALKRDKKGQVIRHKVRLVAKVFSRKHGIDYEETYEPVHTEVHPCQAGEVHCCRIRDRIVQR
ncbi:hypothetical protein PI124_g18404 [Phytophthora idaei]|nr:hypothetical protein PI125_g21560 [Phytophthora idaei]KAG3131553.1 hypothetical protein PI126_g20008 [Phytophthora idaei]KAG3236596.1 hypothetical protein PI124_g18404 [Phytophthora idaei]